MKSTEDFDNSKKKIKVLIVFGTRPEAIKMAPLIHALVDSPDRFDVKVCVTAQHRQMLDQVLELFEITPDIDLNLMKPGQDLFDITISVLQNMKEILRSYKPDVLLVHGDTTTSFATALAGFYEGIPVGHVEAGLRTNNLLAPFPEEFNRQVTSKITRWHFAPTALSKANLIAEQVPSEMITVTGNTVIDALHWVLNRIEGDAKRSTRLNKQLAEYLQFNFIADRFVLITGHRRENFGDGFLNICKALKELALTFQDVHFVYPVHLNPNVQKPVYAILDGFSNVHLIPPLDYEPFVYLLKRSYLVLTDSGGIQEEAPSLGKPVLVMREVTERPEAVNAGTVILVGTNKENIVKEISRLLTNETHYLTMSKSHNPYGDGMACQRIVDVFKQLEVLA